MIDALRHLQYRLLWSGSLFTYAGHWINQVALGWLAYDMTGSGTIVGAVLGFRAVPILVLAPVSGVFADRWSKGAILIAASAVNVVGALALAGLVASGWIATWHLFAFTFVIGAAHVFDRTARHSAVQDLVPTGAVMNAVALNSIAFSLMRVLSPAIAGYLLAWFGAALNFTIQAVLYALAIVVLACMRWPARHAGAAHGSMWESLREGITFAARDRTIRSVFALTAIPFFFMVPVWGTLLPVYAKDVFQAGPQGLGWLFTAVGVGGLAGGIAAAALSRFDRLGSLQLVSFAGFALGLVGAAVSPTLAIAWPFVALAGLMEMIGYASGQTMLQLSAPAAMRGRILSLMQYNPALISMGALVVGIGADLAGPRAITLAAAVVAMVAGAALLAAVPELRTMRASALSARTDRTDRGSK